MRRIAFCSFLTLMLMFCATETQARQYRYSPVWTAQSQFAGFYVARDKGFFKENGLDVSIVYPDLTKPLDEMLTSGKVDFMTMTMMHAMEAVSKGVKLVNIMQTSHNNSLCVVSRYPLSNGLKSLSGKDVSCWYSFDDAIIKLVNKKLAKAPTWVKTNGGMNLFLSGATDYCFCCTYNEVFQLRECGFEVKKGHMIRLQDYGYSLPQEGVYVTEKFFNTHKKEVAQFVKAMTKGWIWTRKNFDAAISITMKEVAKKNISTNRYHQKCMLKEVLRLQTVNGKPQNEFKLLRREFEMAKKLHKEIGYNFGATFTYESFVR